MSKFNSEQQLKLDSGAIVWGKNGKRYGICRECGSLVCLDKVFFSSLHLCSPPTREE